MPKPTPTVWISAGSMAPLSSMSKKWCRFSLICWISFVPTRPSWSKSASRLAASACRPRQTRRWSVSPPRFSSSTPRTDLRVPALAPLAGSVHLITVNCRIQRYGRLHHAASIHRCVHKPSSSQHVSRSHRMPRSSAGATDSCRSESRSRPRQTPTEPPAAREARAWRRLSLAAHSFSSPASSRECPGLEVGRR